MSHDYTTQDSVVYTSWLIFCLFTEVLFLVISEHMDFTKRGKMLEDQISEIPKIISRNLGGLW